MMRGETGVMRNEVRVQTAHPLPVAEHDLQHLEHPRAHQGD